MAAPAGLSSKGKTMNNKTTIALAVVAILLCVVLCVVLFFLLGLGALLFSS